jgi:ABC-2 type transport system ATP-binding protein
VVNIHRGEIVAMDKPEALRDQLQKSARLFVRVGKAESAEAVRKALQNIAGVASVTAMQDGFSVEARRGVDVRPRIASAITSAGWELLELRPLAMSLEDIFLELTVREGADERL